MALNIVSNNNLTNLKELAFTKVTSRNSTPHPPDIDSGIADSGSSGMYFAPGAPVTNYDATAPTIRVCMANGTPVHSIASGELASVTPLPPASRKVHVMAGIPHSLIVIGLAPLVDAGCCVLFTNTAVIAFDWNGKVILECWRKTTTPKLWRWPLLPQVPPLPDLPQGQLQIGPCAHGTQMDAIQAVCSIISSLHPCPVRPLLQSTPPSACPALQERLGTTRVTDNAGEQYGIVFQYSNTAFTVTASSKGGRLHFDP